MKTFHSSELLAGSPPPVEYIVEGLLPAGTGGDLAGMPGAGKSSIVLSMAASISTGTPWFGLKTALTPAGWISGEASGAAAIQRDLHRLKTKEADISFFLPGQVLWRWVGEEWITTGVGRAAVDKIRALGIGFVVVDTTGSLVAGLRELDNDQQRQLARHIRDELHGLTYITISHSNQSSAQDKLGWRLHYLSRAGGNGYPGAVRWAAGVAQLQAGATEKEDEAASFGISAEQTKNKKLVAFGVSKNNEAPQAVWTNSHPALFEIRPDGQLVLVKDGRERCGRKSAAGAKEGGRNAIPSF